MEAFEGSSPTIHIPKSNTRAGEGERALVVAARRPGAPTVSSHCCGVCVCVQNSQAQCNPSAARIKRELARQRVKWRRISSNRNDLESAGPVSGHLRQRTREGNGHGYFFPCTNLLGVPSSAPPWGGRQRTTSSIFWARAKSLSVMPPA